MARGNSIQAKRDKSKVERKGKRTQSLQSQLIQPYTQKLYKEACTWFFNYLHVEGMEIPASFLELDDIVCTAVDFAWGEGEPRALIGNLLSALELWFPATNGHLKGGWKLWRKWCDKELPVRSPPLSWEATLAMVYYMIEWGYFNAGILTLVGFNLFLRTIEMTSILTFQVSFNADLSVAHIVLPLTKVGRRRSTVESVTLRDHS